MRVVECGKQPRASEFPIANHRGSRQLQQPGNLAVVETAPNPQFNYMGNTLINRGQAFQQQGDCDIGDLRYSRGKRVAGNLQVFSGTLPSVLDEDAPHLPAKQGNHVSVIRGIQDVAPGKPKKRFIDEPGGRKGFFRAFVA